ncbi:hypothetical protein [Blastopirellula marina]|uniref:Uncharacterized protein n=1 Tax=Blastopirellula marina TaxID=124 RepID=A0A2S8GPZ0_9BACT|nr:hypothetical protein [Blastopirellula marina]PQO46506.1 hypothetical protein C5Y93_08505 [Blastopirellula marina]
MKKISHLPLAIRLVCLLLALVVTSTSKFAWGQANVAPSLPSGSSGAAIQGFDPYSTAPQYGSVGPSYGGAPTYAAPPPTSSYPPPGSYPPAPSSPPANFSTGPSTFYPQQPQPLYQPAQPFAYQQPQQSYQIPYERFMENLAFEYTFLPKLSDEEDTLQIQDFEASVTALFPNFLFSEHPLLVTPAFVLHLWDGPSTMVQDLPANAYSAYLDFAWNPELTPRLYAELGFRAGIYTDFQTLNTDSLRLQGLAVGNVRLTPTMTLKGGAVYIDRLDTKLLPVFGLLWEPDSLTRFDITFPYPRLSKYWTTFGDKKIWWYVGGEYGGGSWTIHRYDFPTMDDVSDQIDINDYRVFIGLEATHPNRLRAYAEIGYVWDRNIIYRSSIPNLKVDDTVMLRLGFNF